MEAIFGGFASAFHVLLTGGFPFDTLSDSTVLLHDHLDDPRDVAPFAISCVFAANDRTLLVTLPFSTTDEGFAPCLEEYQALVSDWQRPHRIVRSLLSPDGIEPQSVVRMQYTENPRRS